MHFRTPQHKFIATWPLRAVYLLVASLLFCAHSALAEPLKCSDVIGFKTSKAPVEYLHKTSEIYIIRQVREEADFNFSFMAIYHSNSKSIEIRTKLVDYKTGERSSIKGHEAYKEMMELFSQNDVRVIQGNWSQSDNSRAYLQNIRSKNMTPEDAALNTWSGRQAALYGFNHPRVIYEGIGENPQGLKVYQINVDFYKRPPRTGLRRLIFGP